MFHGKYTRGGKKTTTSPKALWHWLIWRPCFYMSTLGILFDEVSTSNYLQICSYYFWASNTLMTRFYGKLLIEGCWSPKIIALYLQIVRC